MLSLDNTSERCTVSALLLRGSLVMLCGTNSPGQLLLKKHFGVTRVSPGWVCGEEHHDLDGGFGGIKDFGDPQ